MSKSENIMLTMMYTVGPEITAEGDRIWKSHANWMAANSPKEGNLALVTYNVTKTNEYINPLDPTSEPTGNIIYTIVEVFVSPDALDNHMNKIMNTWEDFEAFAEWSSKSKIGFSHGTSVLYSLW
jgi:hypothetical protein